MKEPERSYDSIGVGRRFAAHYFPCVPPLAGTQPTKETRDVRPSFATRRVACAIQGTSRLYTVIRERLEAAGVHPAGKRGPHAFRHARAVSLLRSGVPLKVIGDVLGHRSAASTTPYLKLATEELRDVALEIPGRTGGEQP